MKTGIRGGEPHTRVWLAVVALLVVVAGAGLVRSMGGPPASDPAARTTNGGPRGLLGLYLLLAAEGRDIEVRSGFEEAIRSSVSNDSGSHLVVVVPPPERSTWNDAEVRELGALVHGGARLVIVCDDEDARNSRMSALLVAFGAACFRADVALGDTSVTEAAPLLGDSAPHLVVRGTGRVRPRGTAPLFPAWLVGTDAVVLRGPLGAGEVVVVGSATIWANDGLALGDNAAFAMKMVAPESRRLVIDERHHASRAATDVLAAATRGYGPWTAILAVAALVPLSLLMLVPRLGDGPRTDVTPGPPAAMAQARALASLLALAAKSDDTRRLHPTRRRGAGS